MVALQTFRFPAGLIAVGLLAAACSAAPSPKTVETVTVTSTDSPTASGSASPSGSDSGFGNSATSSASPSPSASTVATLGGVCDDLLPASTINAAVGMPLAGTTQFVVGQPDKAIERLVYLNCRYGVAAPAKGKPKVPKVEIGISLYASDLRASSRVQGTISDFVGLGAKATATTVDGKPATILTGYQKPTLVIAVGPRTVAVTVTDKIFGTERDKDMVAIAKAALDATAGFQK